MATPHLEGLNLRSMPVSLQLLTQFPLLHSLSREALDPLSAKMTLRSFARRAMVLSKDSATQELGFLVDGRLQGIDFTVDSSLGLNGECDFLFSKSP